MAKKKKFVGTVISDKMQKTIIVKIVRVAKHPKYSKILKHRKKFKVHDEKGLAHIGDTVRIEETRPLSKDKYFKLVEIVKKASLADVEIKEP